MKITIPVHRHPLCELYEEILRRDFSLNEMNILFTVALLSTALGKQKAIIPTVSQILSATTGLPDREELEGLKRYNVLLQDGIEYSINQDYDSWTVPFNDDEITDADPLLALIKLNEPRH